MAAVKDLKNLRVHGRYPARLTEREQIFVRELMCTREFDMEEAAKKAGYASPKKDAKKLMQKPGVRAAINKLQKERNATLELTAEKLLQELACSALRDPVDLCDENGVIIVNDLRKLPKNIRKTIDQIKIRTRTNKEGDVEQQIELKLTPKLQALELAMKHFGMLEPLDRSTKLVIDWDSLYKQRDYSEQDKKRIEQSQEPRERLSLPEIVRDQEVTGARTVANTEQQQMETVERRENHERAENKNENSVSDTS